ncbi:MAG: Cell division protein ZapA [candidate division BRC1 bacterium ADurb.BinA364]|nr:MAG: Cell division protein ZapA [candidate division BRC1 bacterium ADurb.BinA364]
MSSGGEVSISLSIGGEEIRVRADPARHDRLRETAAEVQRRMQELLDAGTARSAQKAALMAAFQFAYEILERRARGGMSKEEEAALEGRIERMIARIDDDAREAKRHLE